MTTSSRAVNSKTYLTLLLAATTVGGVILAWRQYAELVELRAAAMSRDERADLQKRVWELEKRNRELQERLAARRDTAGGTAATAPGADGETGDRGSRGDPRGRGGNPSSFTALRELMAKPEVQALLNVQQKAALEARYAAFFKNLNLPPDQVEKLKALLMERTTTLQDVASAARDQGLNPRDNPEEYRKLFENARNDVNASIRTAIGDPGFAQLTDYEQTLPQRAVVDDLQRRLSNTEPLTSTQADQLVHILASNAPQRPAGDTAGVIGQMGPPEGGGRGLGGGDLGGMMAGAMGGGPGPGLFLGAFDGGGRASASVAVTPSAVTQAQSVLTPTQVAALQQIQEQQQAQRRLQELVRETIVPATPPANASGSAGPGSGSGASTPGGGTTSLPGGRRGGG